MVEDKHSKFNSRNNFENSYPTACFSFNKKKSHEQIFIRAYFMF